MRAHVAVALAICLLAASIMPFASLAHASARVEAFLEPFAIGIHIRFSHVNASLYELMRGHPGAFNETTIPSTLVAFMREMGLEHVRHEGATMSFDDASRAIDVEFKLVGEDLMAFRYNKTTMERLYEVDMTWRKADVEAVEDGRLLFRLNFSSYFSAPLEEWERVEYVLPDGSVRQALFLNSTAADRLDPAFYVILPEGAELVEAEGDKVVFSLPPEPLDLFMASPFWPFLAVVLATALAAAYRRAAVKRVRASESEGR